MSNISATKKGEKFQELLWNLFENTTMLYDLTGYEISEILNIDSKIKDNPFKPVKNKAKLLFIKEYGKMPNINSSSSIRGDLLLGRKIGDIKNYGKALGQMHLQNLPNDNYIKGIDSNIRYLLFYHSDIFNVEDLSDLKNFYFSSNKDMTWFETMKEKYNTLINITSIGKEDFVYMFYFMELGYAWNMVGIEPSKSFISKVGDDLEYKEIDLDDILEDDVVDVDLMIDDKGYVYIYFYQNGDPIYILSQRGEKENFCSNCSFINKNYMKLVNKVNIDKYVKMLG